MPGQSQCGLNQRVLRSRIISITQLKPGDHNSLRVDTLASGAKTSQDIIGLETGQDMTRSMSLRAGIERREKNVEFTSGNCCWRARADHADLLRSTDLDWFHLESAPDAILVKRNSQRDVWKVTCGSRVYFAKLYHPNGAVARAKLFVRGPTALREWSAGVYASAHSIATVSSVAVAWEGTNGRQGTSLLITEAVSRVEPLHDYWLKVRDDRVRSLMLCDSLARLIARAHQCGFQHDDMHPGNILARCQPNGCEVFFVDLHKVRTGRSVTAREMVINLAQLNQWFRRYATRTQRRRFLKKYVDYRDQFGQSSDYARNWRINPGKLIADLSLQAEVHARKLWAKRDRRTARDSRYFARIKPAPGWRGHVLLQAKHPCPCAAASRLTYTRSQWKQWLSDPLAWVDATRHQLIKNSHTATLCKASLPTEPPTAVIVKRHLGRTAWKRFIHALGPSRTRRSWRIANMLNNRDLPVAAQLMVLERYIARLIRVDSLSMVEYIPDSADLETFLTRDVARLAPDAQRTVKDRLIDAVVTLLKTFYERGFSHRDLKAPNLLVVWPAPYTASPLLTFIDMDGISHMGNVPTERQIRGMVRLCASLLSSPTCTASDRLRFLKRYLTGPGRTAKGWKEMWRLIHREVCNKLESKESRRRWKMAHYGRA